ncbi:hypothetical protein RQP46_010693 [Phenoliferia psychrophenolica]
MPLIFDRSVPLLHSGPTYSHSLGTPSPSTAAALYRLANPARMPPPTSISESSPTPTRAKETIQSKDYRPASTWHLKSHWKKSFAERIVSLGLSSDEYHHLREGVDRGPIPRHSTLREHVFILSRAGIAPLVQQASYWMFPDFKWPIGLAYFVYNTLFVFFVISCVRRFDRFSKVYGTYDEQKIGRDRIPDISVGQLCRALLLTMLGRTAGEFILRWNKNDIPIEAFSWSTPFRMFAWLMVLDYCFYTYHRSCHENDFLWKIHSKHHTTRHPSPVLSILADSFQEVIEIFLCPLAATLTIPMSFHELYLMVCYLIYVEILGHTGLRAIWHLPITGPVLVHIGCELTVEHHRYGKSGRNYGKQEFRKWFTLEFRAKLDA